jgi:polar amino acid transport system permease protein
MTGSLVYLPLFLKATGTTIWLSWLALLIGAVGGTLIALLRTSRLWPLRIVALLYTEAFRSVPILIVLFFAYFGAPVMLGFDVSPFVAATFALALHASANMSEVVRAGIESVGRGQWEAALASGMRMREVMRHIVAPQALRVILPPSVGVYITVLKESSLASIIGYFELTRTGLLVRETQGGGFGPLLALAAIYFILSYGISLCGAALERHYAVGGATAGTDAVVGGMA